ncbi:MAG: SDR family NAD(P)-dependent oxidoreductase [Anaerolineae bacterium]|jgi:NAD(P)-dependent dehydrogenase (short-subunit alcohol dehydrogenase family)|nr:SDR family NAD(P)-dependent oxidoreductase [Anaerolineae bacterium]
MSAVVQGKIALVTGATSGIGQETAIGLAKQGIQVIITGRNRERGGVAVTEIQHASGNPNIEFVSADMASQASVHSLADHVMAKYPRLDILINNAGVMAADHQLSEDGIEIHFAINHLAPFLLTHRLLPLLRHSAPTRVVNVTGGMPGKIDLNNLQAEQGPYIGFIAYSHSKSVMMAASYELAQRLNGTDVTVNVAYPGGVMSTKMGSQPILVPLWMRPIFGVVRRALNTTAEKAARSSIYLASAPEMEGKTGLYLNTHSRRVGWPKSSYDQAIRAKIWEVSERLIQLKPQPI